jgi:hypothetical protein
MMDSPRASQDFDSFRHAVQPPDTFIERRGRLSPAFLEALRETEIPGDRCCVVGQRVEKSPRLKAGKVECKDNVWRGRPTNLEISLIAEIAGAAGIGWINQGPACKSVDPVVC